MLLILKGGPAVCSQIVFYDGVEYVQCIVLIQSRIFKQTELQNAIQAIQCGRQH